MPEATDSSSARGLTERLAKRAHRSGGRVQQASNRSGASGSGSGGLMGGGFLDELEEFDRRLDDAMGDDA